MSRIFLAVLGLVSACSGAKTASYSSIDDSGAASAGPMHDTLIDDMEGTAGTISWTPPLGTMPGAWFSFSDVQCDDLSPTPTADATGPAWTYAEVPSPYTTFPGVVSRHASRLRTTAPLLNTWGAGMGFNLAEVPLETLDGGIPENRSCSMGARHDLLVPVSPVDLRGYRGITFWAMASRQGTTTLRVELEDGNTMPEGKVCLDAAGDLGNCYNGFGAFIDLTDTFTQYTFDFSSLTQNPTWGYHPAVGALDSEHVYRLQFIVLTPDGNDCSPTGPLVCAAPSWANQLNFDVWIDDLYFVQR